MEKKQIILTVGLSGSGKTYWANEYVKQNPTFRIVCRDDIRERHFGSRKNFKREEDVTKICYELISSSLENGWNVIVADTNLNPKFQKQLVNKFRGKAEVRIKDLTRIPIETCIEQDKKRPVGEQVGEDVIRKQYDTYKEVYWNEPVIQDKSLPRAVISDLDGTLALTNSRIPFDYEKLVTDDVREDLKAELWDFFKRDYQIIYLSGRPDTYKILTQQWLQTKDCPHGLLYMRKEGDFRDDTIIKKELFDAHIRGKYYVEKLWDDRPRVCRLWQQLGLNLVDVGYGVEF